MPHQGHKKYSLQITISTVFIIITLVIGTVLSLQNYHKTSAIILSSAGQLYTQIARELRLEFQATYSPMAGTLQLLRQADIVHTQTLAQRLQDLKYFKAILESTPAIYSLLVGFPNGDTFAVSLLGDAHTRAYFDAPATASLLVLQAEKDTNGQQQVTRLFFDDQLREILRQQSSSDFKLESRPWYTQATDTLTTTRPFLFHGINIVGLSAMIKANEPGVVVALDVTLDSLAKTIAKYRITDNSEVILLDADKRVLAYRGVQYTGMTGNTLTLKKLQDIDSDVLTHLNQNLTAREQSLDFSYLGQAWTGQLTKVGQAGDSEVFALLISPVDELLADAASIRWQSLFTALIIILLSIPAILFTARRISNPLRGLARETQAITHFQFDTLTRKHSCIKEVSELDSAIDMMKGTINKFIKLINALAGEQDLDALLKSITHETMQISQADGALTYLFDDNDNRMKPSALFMGDEQSIATDRLADLSPEATRILLDMMANSDERIAHIQTGDTSPLAPLLEIAGCKALSVLIIPLRNRNAENIGVLCIIYKKNLQKKPGASDHPKDTSIAFIEALSGFAAVTLESRQMLNMQKALLTAFIRLTAGAIDAKSPYTGGHCQRVPEITFLLAQAACDSSDGSFQDFELNTKQWQELEIACWLHDCGKVTTPEYIVDKSTKLETIYDRIHEIRMRFEVLKRDAQIHYWQQRANGGDAQTLQQQLDEKLCTLDDDFAFVAECNEGGEFMADERMDRLQRIADITWLRTLDDRIGISWEELRRKQRTSQQSLPVTEKLLADQPEHIIERPENERMGDDNPWGFKLDTPAHKYNRGEIYNLGIRRGTLSAEDRFKINEHMVQTIIMLRKLPFPKGLRDVPEIAGCHHETMDGKGYPRRLGKDDIPLTGRMMAIADIFEALTASDRPYKKAKTLSEALRIMRFMRNDQHIDADLFDLFLRSGTYLKYAEKFLDAGQIDTVDIDQLLAKTSTTSAN